MLSVMRHGMTITCVQHGFTWDLQCYVAESKHITQLEIRNFTVKRVGCLPRQTYCEKRIVCHELYLYTIWIVEGHCKEYI